MNRFKDERAVVRQPLSAAPAYELLCELWNQAQRTQDTQIQQPWQSSDGSVYTLSVVIHSVNQPTLIRKSQYDTSSFHNNPTWTLLQDRGGERSQIWQHTTNDIGLIVSMISANTIVSQTQSNALRLSSEADNTPSVTTRGPSDGMREKVTLAGDLKEIQLPDVLQSISLCRMTGKLSLKRDELTMAELFFTEGNIQHADIKNTFTGERQSVGDDAILELFMWTEGEFRFQPDWTASHKTVTRRLESLLLEGTTMSDYHAYVVKAGVTAETRLIQTRPYLSDAEVEEIINSGVPHAVDQQKHVYQQIGPDGITFGAIAAEGKVPRLLYNTILYNLMNLNLIHVADKKGAALQPFEIDQNAASWAFKSLTNPDTGLVKFPLFLMYLEQEFDRHKKIGTPLSVAFIQPRNNLLEVQARIAECFARTQHKFDIIANVEGSELVCLLPHRKTPQAYLDLERFAAILSAEYNVKSNDISIGIACIPEDTSTIEMMLAQGRDAKNRAVESSSTICTCKGIESEPWVELAHKGEEAVAANQWDEAEKHWTAALEYAEGFAKDDPRLCKTVEQLAQIFMAQQRYSVAEPMITTALDLRMGLLGKTISDSFDLLDALASCCYAQGKFEETEKSLMTIIALYKRELPETAEHARALYNLATVYHMQMKLEEADETYKRTISIRKKALGEDHPDTLKAKSNYGKLMRDLTQRTQRAPVISGTWAVFTPNEILERQN